MISDSARAALASLVRHRKLKVGDMTVTHFDVTKKGVELRLQKITPLKCQWCGKDIEGRRRDRKFCGGTCRQNHTRKGKR